MSSAFDWVVGIDPGKSGGVAIGDAETRRVSVFKMPLLGDEIDSLSIFRRIQKLGSPKKVRVVVEKVSSMPHQGVTSTFTFGKGCGKILATLEILEVSYRLVLPPAWKKIVLAGTAKDKNAAIEYVARTYPGVPLVPPGCKKPHDGIADAVCLMDWGLRDL